MCGQVAAADEELKRLSGLAVAQSPAVAQARISAAGAAIKFQHTVDHEQWSL